MNAPRRILAVYCLVAQHTGGVALGVDSKALAVKDVLKLFDSKTNDSKTAVYVRRWSDGVNDGVGGQVFKFCILFCFFVFFFLIVFRSYYVIRHILKSDSEEAQDVLVCMLWHMYVCGVGRLIPCTIITFTTSSNSKVCLVFATYLTGRTFPRICSL